jgi:hypothetical protein
MATERQIAANRANAQRSTGPKTAAGKMKSSRNAFRHGLSGPLPLNLARWSEIDAIARALTPQGAEQGSAAIEFAKAQVELFRIRAVRMQMWLGIDRAGIDPRKLNHLVSLDRYERYAVGHRRRAALNLEDGII